MPGIAFVNKLTPNWSTATRITVSNAGVILVCFLVLTAGVMLLSQYFMRQHIEESVRAELNILDAEFQLDGLRGVTSLINSRLEESSPLDKRNYFLTDANAQKLAGNLTHWPYDSLPADEYVWLPSHHDKDDYSLVVMWHQLPQGYRILVGFDEREMAYVQRKIRQGATWSLLLVLLLSWLAGRYTTRLALRPIGEIRHTASLIMQGDLRHRIPIRHTGDEFDELASTLNDMLDRIDRLLTGLRNATDNIAHDLRSPLTRHRARLESMLIDTYKGTDIAPLIEASLTDVDQVLVTFNALLKIAGVDSGVLRAEFTQVDLSLLVMDAVEFMEPLAESREQTLTFSLPAQAISLGHRDLLFQLLINLLDNALKYSPPKSLVTISLKPNAKNWQLEINDQGPGIPDAATASVFDRLFRLDATRQTPGLGLGLSLVKSVVQLHGGQIALLPAQPHREKPGLCVRVLLANSCHSTPL